MVKLIQGISILAASAALCFAGALSEYVAQFNRDDAELYVQHIPNAKAEEFLRKNIPLFECPDKDIERAYYFRWWTFRKHIKKTPEGFVITEFLPDVPWAGKYNAIVCPSAHHFAEGRWLADKSIVADYARHWAMNPADSRKYSAWLAHSCLNAYYVSRDLEFLRRNYGALKNNFFEWQKTHFDAPAGLFWQTDNHDGMEFSISGGGYRATINSYMFAECAALAEIARMLGLAADAEFFSARAEAIKRAINEKLWDNSAGFYKVIPRGSKKFSDARELHGYTPWLFGIPPAEYSAAWREISDERGFKAPLGLTTAERRHPKFRVAYSGHECLWDGPVWPFATSITLEALANFLNDYPPCGHAGKGVYFDALKTYAKSHVRVLEDGRKIMWIDENQDPFTGVWIARERLQNPESKKEWGVRAWRAKQGGKERGKDYNHSQFCNLVISGLVGVRPRAGGVVDVNPLVPDSWRWFSLKNISIGGKKIDVIYDADGGKYGAKGLNVYVDGVLAASAEKPRKISLKLGE